MNSWWRLKYYVDCYKAPPQQALAFLLWSQYVEVEANIYLQTFYVQNIPIICCSFLGFVETDVYQNMV